MILVLAGLNLLSAAGESLLPVAAANASIPPGTTAFEQPVINTGVVQMNNGSSVPAQEIPTQSATAQPAPVSTNTPRVEDLSVPKSVLTASPRVESTLAASATNSPQLSKMSEAERIQYSKERLELGRYMRSTRQTGDARTIFVELMADGVPDAIQRSALLELGALAQDDNDLPRTLQIYAQFLTRWSDDLRAPEVLLRQGQIFRRLGINNLALTKFYAVMAAALVLKSDSLDYYERVVLQAQIEIAETHYQLGKYSDAAEFLFRLIKQNNPALDRSQTLYKLARSYAAMERHEETTASAQDFLARYPDAPEQPEVRFYLALALKQLGRNNESLQQVLMLLQEQRGRTKNQPEVWAYWQQRTGNLIANQLYREGDYPKALDIYLNLVQLDNSTAWQLPVRYQIGMTYERLMQPQKAVETYAEILNHEKELTTNSPPSLKAVLDMARWRISFIQWQNKAETANQSFHTPDATKPPITASLLNTNNSRLQ